MKKLLILFIAITAHVSIAQESIKLRLNYTPGDVYNVSMNMKQEMGVVMSMGMDINMNMEITEVNGDTYESKMKFTKMTMDMLQGGMAMSYDSSKSDDELDASGKAMKTQMQPMLEAVMFTKGNNLGEVLETSIEPQVLGMEDLAKNQTSNIIYPKEAVKVGSTWSITKEEKGNKMSFTYKVNSISKEKVVWNITGNISGNATGTITGTMNVDRASGVPLNTIIDMKMMIMNQEMTSNVTMKMVKS